MRVPPRWLRRPIQLVLLALVTVLVLGTLPVTVPLALLAGLLPGVGSGALRLLVFAVAFVLSEIWAVLAAAALWVTGRGHDEQAHDDVLRRTLDRLVRLAGPLLGLRLRTDELGWSPLDDGIPGSTNAMIVLGRHAGAGDSLLLVRTLLDRDHLRRPRVVVKDLLRWDPTIDLYLGRRPSAFLPPGADTQAQVAEAARGLDVQDALLLFPEGGNFTVLRRARAITRLRDRGLTASAASAEAMTHVLPPRPAGFSAAREVAPHADVVLVAHVGLEELTSLSAVVRAVPLRSPVLLRWTFVPAAEVPEERDAQIRWLFARWAEIDAWVGAHRASCRADD